AARRAQEQLVNGANDLPPLHGIPVTVKDLTNTAGVRTTYGSVAFADHVPDEDSAAWARLKAAGAILIGKTTTPEFGMLGITESQLTGITSNPWDPATTSGGSSGGAAAAVAAGIAPLAWGRDGGGANRGPAARSRGGGLLGGRGPQAVHGTCAQPRPRGLVRCQHGRTHHQDRRRCRPDAGHRGRAASAGSAQPASRRPGHVRHSGGRAIAPGLACRLPAALRHRPGQLLHRRAGAPGGRGPGRRSRRRRWRDAALAPGSDPLLPR